MIFARLRRRSGAADHIPPVSPVREARRAVVAADEGLVAAWARAGAGEEEHVGHFLSHANGITEAVDRLEAALLSLVTVSGEVRAWALLTPEQQQRIGQPLPDPAMAGAQPCRKRWIKTYSSAAKDLLGVDETEAGVEA